MKILTSTLFIFILGFSSCDKLDELNTKTIEDIEISETVLIEANALKSTQIKSGETDVTFSKTLTLDLNNIKEIQDYLSHLENMNLKSFTCKITDLGEGLISSLQVSIPELNYSVDVTSIQTDKALQINFTVEQLKEIANSLLEDQSLKIVLSGTVEQAVDFSIKTTALADIEVEIL